MKRTAFIALACVALAACVTPTAYAPAAGPASSGYWTVKIEADRFRVSYRGGNGAPFAQVDDYALMRAAQVTLAEGYAWFQVVARFRDGAPGRGPQLSVGGGSTSFGRRSSVGVGIGVGAIDLSGGPQLTTTLEIKLGKGDKPDQADVYDARDVALVIGARLPPPLPR